MAFSVGAPGHTAEHNRLLNNPVTYAADFGITGVGTADQAAYIAKARAAAE